jgi:hypothetical protein
MVKSSVYAAALSYKFDVQNVKPFWSLYSHLRSGSRNSINKYGLSVSPRMVPLCMCMGAVLLKCSPMYMVVELWYMLPINLQASLGILGLP